MVKKKKAKMVKITLRKSPIGYSKRQKATVRALGLKRINHTIEHEDSHTLRGMLDKVNHLIEIVE